MKELLSAARNASRTGRHEETLQLLEQIPYDGSSEAVRARQLAGGLLLSRFRQLTATEHQFRRAVPQDKGNLLANNRLAWLMHLGTHAWERGPFELTVIRNGQPTLERMKTLATSPALNTGARFIDECATGQSRRSCGALEAGDPGGLFTGVCSGRGYPQTCCRYQSSSADRGIPAGRSSAASECFRYGID